MASFKTISTPKVLYETMRAYDSVNNAGQLSFWYKFALCCVYLLQTPFNQFDVWRKRELLIASCKWQYGQLTNVLNILYGVTNITIDQNSSSFYFAPNIDDGESLVFAPNIDDGESSIMAPNIDDLPLISTMVTFHIPIAVYTASLAQLISDIEQIKISGVQYQIVSF